MIGRMGLAMAALTLTLLATPVLARESLGMFDGWGAFRDPRVPRCYAIAMAARSGTAKSGDYQPYATVGHWPQKRTRNQIHFRLSRRIAANAPVRLTIGNQTFALTGGDGDAWAADRRGDAAIVAAMRSAKSMRVSARAATGSGFSDSYQLAGAATAIDAAALGCARSAGVAARK